MDQTLKTIRITATSPQANTAGLSSPLRSPHQGASVSPVKALFCDDLQLQSYGEQSDAAVLQQLMQWTAQLLQRMLQAAEGATREARGDLEAAVKELVDERKQYVSQYRAILLGFLSICRPQELNPIVEWL